MYIFDYRILNYQKCFPLIGRNSKTFKGLGGFALLSPTNKDIKHYSNEGKPSRFILHKKLVKLWSFSLVMYIICSMTFFF